MGAAQSETKLQPASGLRAGAVHPCVGDRIRGYVAASRPMISELKYRDREGDEVVFKVVSGKLQKIVNGTFARNVTRLNFKWQDYEIRDQATWGGCPQVDDWSRVVYGLQELAVDCNVPNNLPQKPYVPRGAEVRVTYNIKSLPSTLQSRVREAMHILAVDVPCLLFTETGTSAQLTINAEQDGCWSHLGFVGSGNQMNLDPSWRDHDGPALGTVLHELLHFLGVAHEHQRDDRHEFVVVDPNNVRDNPVNHAANANVHPFRYDSASIMHYPSGKGLDCTSRQWCQIGQRSQLSQLDKLFLNMLYPPVAGFRGYNPKKGSTGLWYCGRSVMGSNNFPFGKVGCDGRCGPTNGPNCPSCIMFGISEGNEYPLKRGDAFQTGETGLFYCGKKYRSSTTTSTTIHDGVCGPNNGPNCPQCNALLD